MKTDFIKIVSLNIEKDKHLDKIITFLKKQKPDVILLQEVFSKDLSQLERNLKMRSTFAGMKILQQDGASYPFGLATFSSLPMVSSLFYYNGSDKNLPISLAGEPLKTARVALVTELSKDKKKFILINTHFTWTPDGQASDLQHKDLPELLNVLAKFPDFVLCGDLNAPRGRVIFDKIASIYKDNIPAHITTTIDKTLHRAGDLQLVVDCLFSTSTYTVEKVEVSEGLSDHCAITAIVL
jgi:endonuclease/exonuclease/phosphatase family metal-dependent hydrolase